MKTAGVGSILSVMCVGFASACSSPVSIGHNDNKAATADSGQQGGQGQPLGTGGGGPAPGLQGVGGGQMLMGGTIGIAGQAGSAGGSAGPPPGFGPSSAFEASPGSLVEVDGGSSGCTPLDSTGAVASGPGWTLLPGTETNACVQLVLEAPAEIYAVHSVNSPGVVRSWVGLSPTVPPNASGQDCATAGPPTLLHTVNAYEQLTIFKAPIHADTGAFIAGGFNVANTTEQPLTGEGQIWLLASPPPSMVPCAGHGASAGMDGGWELESGQELMECMRHTLNSEHQPFVVRVENGSGAMKSVLSYGDPTGPDGVEGCDETSDAANQLAIVVGATTVEAKPRDARMMPGQQLVLRVHAVNVTDRRRTGTVSVRLY